MARARQVDLGHAASTGHGFIRSSQFAKSRLATSSAIGPPSVRPWRTPEVTSAASRSIFMRPPRPWPSWRRAMSALIEVEVELEAGGQSLDDAGEAGAVGLPGRDQAQRHARKLGAPGFRPAPAVAWD